MPAAKQSQKHLNREGAENAEKSNGKDRKTGLSNVRSKKQD
jgi:hypothetical protein